MSKRITTRWFIGAWIVAVLAGIVMDIVARNAQGTSPPPTLMVAYLIAVAAGLAMFVMWIGALIKIGQQRVWGCSPSCSSSMSSLLERSGSFRWRPTQSPVLKTRLG